MYPLSAALQTDVSKIGKMILGSVSLENVAGTGTLTQYDTLVNLPLAYAPAKIMFKHAIIVTTNPTTYVQALVSIETNGTNTVIKSQTTLTGVTNIKRIVLDFTYHIE